MTDISEPVGIPQHGKIRNERVIVERRVRRRRQDRIADATTTFSGSLAFVYLHTCWFLLWLLLNSAR